MTDKGRLKEEVKKQIRSILLSWPRGLTVKEMFQDYKSFMGSELPFRKLGYSTAEIFFSDIRDVVQMSWQRGEMFLKGVSDESTRHIEELVSRQKTPKRSKSRGTKRAPPHHVRNRSSQPPRPDPTVPVFIRKKIKDLMSAYSNGILSFHLEAAYEKRFSTSLKYRQLGFKCLLDLLSAIPDTVELKENANGFMVFPVKQYPVPSRHQEQNVRFNVPSKEKEIKETCEQELLAESPSRTAEAESFEDGSADDSFEENNCGIDKNLQKDIQTVLSRRPEGIWASVYQFEFKEVTGKSLPIKELGYLSVISLMDALPHLVSIERPTSRDWLLFDARLKSNEAVNTGDPQSKKGKQHHVPTSTAPTIDTCIRETIRQVVAAYPDGLPMRQLPTAYKTLTGKELPLRELGYATLEVMLMQLSDVVVMDYAGPNQILLHVIETASLGTNLLIQHPDAEKKGIPVDAVGPGISYLAMKLPTDFSEYIEIFVSYINNPGDIYLQLKGHNTIALEEIMDRLEDVYYGESSDDYMMPESMLTIGQVCVAIYPEDDNWHRVTITGIKDSNFIEVFFVDYGGICCVHKSNLRLLKNRFLKLPAQACKGRLANIRPVNGDIWPPAAKTRMLSLCAGKPLICLITDISNEMVMSTCLCDTSNPEEDIHINDALLMDGLAELHADIIQTRNITQVEESIPTVDRSSPDGSACESGEVKLPRHVRFIQLTDEYNCHLIKCEGKPYIVSGEVSALLWEKDLLRSMLRQKKANVPKVIVNKEENPEIFEEFSRYEVPGTKDKEGLKSYITLYSLESVIKVLELFNHPCKELHQSVREQIELFDPEDIYWNGDDPKSISDQSEEETDSSDSDDTEDDSDEEIGIEMLESALQILQMKRKKILQTLMSVSTSEQSTEPVDELDVVEKQIMDIKKRIRLQNGGAETDQNEGNNLMAKTGQSKIQQENTISTSSFAEFSVPATSLYQSASDVIKSERVEQAQVSPPPVANLSSSQRPHLNTMFSNLSLKPDASVVAKQQKTTSNISNYSQNPQTANVSPRFIPQQMPYQNLVSIQQQVPFQNSLSMGPNYFPQQLPLQQVLPQQDPVMSQMMYGVQVPTQVPYPCDMLGLTLSMNQAQCMYSNQPQQGGNWMGSAFYQGMPQYTAPHNQGPARPIVKRLP